MKNEFAGKNIIITGGTTGIGEATVDLFLSLEANVFNLDIKKSNKQNIHNYHEFSVDMLNVKQVEHSIDEIKKITNNKIDVLFCNAGIHYFGDILATNEEIFDRVVGTNLKGLFFTLKSVLPVMYQNKKGSVVLMGSDQCFVGKGESAVYGLTKGAIGQLTKSTAIDAAAFDVRINCVCPGTIETPLYHNAVRTYCAKNNIETNVVYEGLKTAQPIKRVGQSIEVANVVKFLASSEASFVTGSLFSVDGGYIAQ